MEILAVLSDTAFGMHEIPHDGPYNAGIRNMEYALNLLAGGYAGNCDEPNINGFNEVQSHIILSIYGTNQRRANLEWNWD